MKPSAPDVAIVFISYRRDDSIAYAGRLYDRLRAHFGDRGQVFLDLDTIEPGEDFVDKIEQTVASCKVLVAIIGKQWLTLTDREGRARISDPNDFVHLEIKAALDRRIRVIPALVGGAAMPRRPDLPPALGALARRNAIEISDTRFNESVARLIDSVESTIAQVDGYEANAPRVEKKPAKGSIAAVPSQRRSAVADIGGAIGQYARNKIVLGLVVIIGAAIVVVFALNLGWWSTMRAYLTGEHLAESQTSAELGDRAYVGAVECKIWKVGAVDPKTGTAEILKDQASPRLGKHQLISFKFANSGNTPARKVALRGGWKLLRTLPSSDDFPTVYAEGNLERSVVTMPKGTEHTASYSPILSEYDVTRIRYKTGYLVVLGLLTYQDVFGSEHTTKYCYWYNVGMDDMSPCPGYNTMD